MLYSDLVAVRSIRNSLGIGSIKVTLQNRKALGGVAEGFRILNNTNIRHVLINQASNGS